MKKGGFLPRISPIGVVRNEKEGRRTEKRKKIMGCQRVYFHVTKTQLTEED